MAVSSHDFPLSTSDEEPSLLGYCGLLTPSKGKNGTNPRQMFTVGASAAPFFDVFRRNHFDGDGV
jgi:hypothetical protein